jgi:ER lumen protein retaining receptor
MKIFFISVTLIIIYLIRFNIEISKTYNRNKEDDFPHQYLIPFALIMSLLIHSEFTLWEMIWSFSLWLESVAIFPQINILTKNNGVESFTGHYIASLGAYRFFYLLSWVYRYYYDNYFSLVSVLSGALQVLLYADFFYLYLKHIKNQFISDLPISINDEKKMLKI